LEDAEAGNEEVSSGLNGGPLKITSRGLSAAASARTASSARAFRGIGSSACGTLLKLGPRTGAWPFGGVYAVSGGGASEPNTRRKHSAVSPHRAMASARGSPCRLRSSKSRSAIMMAELRIAGRVSSSGELACPRSQV